MAIVTAIKPQKFRKNFNIFIDGKFSFGASPEIILKYNLKVEKEISGAELQSILEESELGQTYAKVLRLISIRPRSRSEIETWMKGKDVGELLAKKVLDKLVGTGLVNDQEFARWWIDQRLTFRKNSARAIAQELKSKGIPREVIDELLEEMVPKDKERVLIKELIKKNAWRWEKLPKKKGREKVIGFLSRRGFGWEEISSVIDEIEEER